MSLLSAEIVPVTFYKSLANQANDYRLVVLKNGLVTLLVCDPSLDAAACSLAVAAGSHRDPSNEPGIAHLCEHMLCSGTKEFPGSSFMDYVNANGGGANAFTTGEQTCFYFEAPVIQCESTREIVFEHALRNFSSFFNYPTFTTTALKNEIAAINSEHESNLMDISKIFYHGLRILANKHHPFSRFSTGNSRTLSPTPKCKSQLVAYFNSHFVAAKMSLVIKGPQSLNTLQKLATSNFTDIRQEPTKVAVAGQKKRFSRSSTSSSNSDATSIKTRSASHLSLNILESQYMYNCQAFTRNDLQKLLFIENHQHSTIHIVFPLPKCQPLFYDAWCNLIGDESKNSLADYLTNEKNYISKILVFTQDLSVNDKVMVVDIDLTRLGLKNLIQLLLTIFAYLKSLTKLSVKYLSRYMCNLLTIMKQNYYHQNVQFSSMDDVSELAMKLHQPKGLENLLRGFPEVEIDYNSKNQWYNLAKECIGVSERVLSMNNFVILMAHSDSSVLRPLTEIDLLVDNDTFFKDEHYNFDYQTWHINSLQLYRLVEDDDFRRTNIKLPEFENQFILYTHDELDSLIQKISLAPATIQFSMSKNAISLKPTLLDYSDNHEVWFNSHLESSFTSKVYVSFQLHFLDLKPNPHNHACTELLCELLGFELNGNFYGAEMVGYSWGIHPNFNSNSSVAVTVSGISKGICDVVAFVVKIIKDYLNQGITKLNYKLLKRARVKIRRAYADLTKSSGVMQSIAGIMLFLEENVWGIDERLGAIEYLDVESLKTFTKEVAKGSIYSEVLVSGECSEDIAHRISSNISDFYKHPSLSQLHLASSYFLQPRTNYMYSTVNFNRDDPLNTVSYFIQLGERNDVHTRSIGELTSYFLSSRATLELRTKRQLGYTVLCNTVLNRQTIGIGFTVMSSEYNGVQMVEEIEEFCGDMEVELAKMSEKDFRTQILQPFLISIDERANGGVTNMAYSVPPSVYSGSFDPDSKSYRIHKNDWVKIVEKTYRFESKDGNDEIDKTWIQSITKEDFLGAYVRLVSVKSPTRSSLAIVVDSAMDKLTRHQQIAGAQLRACLSQQGIEESAIETILHKCGGDPTTMHLQMLKQSHKWKYVAASCKTAVDSKFKRSKADNTKSKSVIKRKVLSHPSELHRTTRLVRVDYLEHVISKHANFYSAD